MFTYILTGPESSGKSTLAEALHQNLGGILLPEYARKYLSIHGPSYEYDDMLKMALKQLELENNLNSKDEVCILDTDLLTYLIWSTFKYKKVDSWITEAIKEYTSQTNRFYFLCHPEIEWEPDPLRENPEDRNQLFNLYKEALESFNLEYLVLRGNLDERLSAATNQIQNKMFI